MFFFKRFLHININTLAVTQENKVTSCILKPYKFKPKFALLYGFITKHNRFRGGTRFKNVFTIFYRGTRRHNPYYHYLLFFKRSMLFKSCCTVIPRYLHNLTTAGVEKKVFVNLNAYRVGKQLLHNARSATLLFSLRLPKIYQLHYSKDYTIFFFLKQRKATKLILRRYSRQKPSVEKREEEQVLADSYFKSLKNNLKRSLRQELITTPKLCNILGWNALIRHRRRWRLRRQFKFNKYGRKFTAPFIKIFQLFHSERLLKESQLLQNTSGFELVVMQHQHISNNDRSWLRYFFKTAKLRIPKIRFFKKRSSLHALGLRGAHSIVSKWKYYNYFKKGKLFKNFKRVIRVYNKSKAAVVEHGLNYKPYYFFTHAYCWGYTVEIPDKFLIKDPKVINSLYLKDGELFKFKKDKITIYNMFLNNALADSFDFFNNAEEYAIGVSLELYKIISLLLLKDIFL